MSKRVIAAFGTHRHLSSVRPQRANHRTNSSASLPEGPVFQREAIYGNIIGSDYTSCPRGQMMFLEEGDELGNQVTWFKVKENMDSNAQYRQPGIACYTEDSELLFFLGTDAWTGSSSHHCWTPAGYLRSNRGHNQTYVYSCEFGEDNGDGTSEFIVTEYTDGGLVNQSTILTIPNEYKTKKISKVTVMGGESPYSDNSWLHYFLVTSGMATPGLYPVFMYPTEVTSDTTGNADLTNLQRIGGDLNDNIPIFGDDGQEFFFKKEALTGVEDPKYAVKALIMGGIGDSPNNVGVEFVYRKTSDTANVTSFGETVDFTNNSFEEARGKMLKNNPETGLPFTIAELEDLEFGVRFKEKT